MPKKDHCGDAGGTSGRWRWGVDFNYRGGTHEPGVLRPMHLACDGIAV